jgi:hypothetical protein
MADPKARLWACIPWLGFACGVGLASPALAETTTLSCEGDLKNGGVVTGLWNESIDIDSTAGWVSIPILGMTKEPAAFTDKEIRILRGPPGHVEISGIINRLSGAVDIGRIYYATGYTISVQGRCRPATQRF